MNNLARWILIILMILGITIVSLAQEDSEEVTLGEAFVNDVVVEVDDDITLTITGDLPDACTRLGDITQSIEEDVIMVMVTTTRPADAMCATVLKPYEETYTLDTTDLEDGTYQLDVNGVTTSVTIGDAEEEEASTCPEVDEETLLYDDNGICFLYPAEFDVLDGQDFIFISQPLTNNAVLLINIQDADEITLADLQADLEDEDVSVEEARFGDVDALFIEDDTMREAYLIANDNLYHLIVQGLDEDGTGDDLWSTVMEQLFFYQTQDEA